MTGKQRLPGAGGSCLRELLNYHLMCFGHVCPGEGRGGDGMEGIGLDCSTELLLSDSLGARTFQTVD